MQPILRRSSVFASLAIVFGSCGSPSRDIRGRDHGTLLPAIRTVINLRGDQSGSRSHPITEFELDIAGADGDSSNAGMKVGEYRLVEGGIAMRFGRRVRDRLQFVGITGLGMNRLDVTYPGNTPIDDEVTEVGLRLGAEFRAEITSWLSGHLRVVTFWRPFDLMSTQAEIALVFGDPDELGFLVGFKEWRYDDESSDLGGVDEVDLRVDGLFIGMELKF